MMLSSTLHAVEFDGCVGVDGMSKVSRFSTDNIATHCAAAVASRFSGRAYLPSVHILRERNKSIHGLFPMGNLYHRLVISSGGTTNLHTF